MSNLRVMYSKGENVKYISHLDTLRTFERTLRRAGVPIVYSCGFNPRQQLSFGLPLSVGVTSDVEYVDLEMQEDIPESEVVEKLNKSIPEGFKIKEAKYIESKESLMSSVGAASYELQADVRNCTIEEIKENIKKFLKSSSIIVEKESKGKKKEVDIRNDIFDFKLTDYKDNQADFFMTISAGSVSNLKPELLIKAFKEFSGILVDINRIHRIGLYGKNLKDLFVI